MTFRHLLRALPRPILRLAFPRRRIEPLGPVDPSVDRPRQRLADNLFRVRDRNREAAVHVEIERDWRRAIPPRLFEYASAATIATQLPVSSVVVLLRPGGRPPVPAGVYRIRGIRGETFVFRYHVVPLWRLDAQRMRAELGVEGAPFYVAMRGADEAFVRSLADEVTGARHLADSDRRMTTRLLYLSSAAILGTDAARRIFQVEWLLKDPNVQELIREWEDMGRAIGHAEGHAVGHAEGHAEGRAAEARRMLQRVLAARSLPVGAELRAKIDREQDVERLESWLDAAATADSIDDVFP